jgi:hypothetical protein
MSVRAGREDLARYLAFREADRKRAAFRAANKNAEMPIEDGKVIAERRNLEGKAVKRMWRVSGVELVSSVLQYNNKTDWLPKLQQINKDLTTEDHRAFFPEAEDAGLHVHVAINGNVDTNLDSPLGLACIKNVIALYALFEDKIGKWFPVPRRDNLMAVRMRHGMEATADAETAPLYTPQLFTELLYETNTVKELVTLTTNSDKGKYVTVCISEKRRNKPTTLEFRQHHATIDSETIKWWITFVCQLIRFATFLAQMGVQLRDNGSLLDTSLAPDRSSLVENFGKDHSILDLIGFPAAGKKFYKEATEFHKDDFHDAERELDLWIIGRRADASRRTGRVTTRNHDARLRRTKEYKDEVKRLEGVFKASGLKQKEATFLLADSWLY